MGNTSRLSIWKIDHEDAGHRRALYDYLGPQEAHALFIVANLSSRLPGSHLYIASRGSEWVGIAGYYELPKSLIPFSTDPDVARALARHVAEIHPVEWVNGIGYAAWPAYEQLLALGFTAMNDPRDVLMELPLSQVGELPRATHEERVRLIRPEEAEELAWLIRYLTRPGDTSPMTAEEIAKIRMNPHRLVLEADRRIVATASTNGLGLRAFQILAVVTHPDARQRGYARAVCSALIRQMRKQGAEHCVLFTHHNNSAAKACYEGLGFRVTGNYCLGKVQRPMA
ncbi:MAG TPA: GNAT family N-acetyltransferase [Tepidisphaeraceae bacterium]|nr:GNAT family N-acetyltransferase [Tepidisphaeraceae bacterium]